MKKLYTTILIIAVALFISCDENKAKDEIKKALDKTVDETDKAKTKPALTKPVVSSKTVRVEYAATFTKVEGHTYTLKEAISGVTLSDVPGDTTKKQVSSTQAASNVIIVATLDGNTEESDPIEFISVYVANRAALQDEIRKTIEKDGATAKFNYIDTSDITDMSSLFQNNTTFNGDISKWNTSKVTDMEYMFYGATAFNQPLNAWNVSSVEKMESMFRDATSFNQPLNAWNVSNVTDMYHMFNSATAFNQPLDNWTVSSVTDMDYMFYGATAFNKPLNNWDVSSVAKMRYMFYGATSFNQDLTAWVDLSGRGTYNMFSGATAMQESYKPSWVE